MGQIYKGDCLIDNVKLNVIQQASPITPRVELLVVGGGGGGGGVNVSSVWSSGAGGGGGIFYCQSYELNDNCYGVSIGCGGESGYCDCGTHAYGDAGGSSMFYNSDCSQIVCTTGGGGGTGSNCNYSSGCGGGGDGGCVFVDGTFLYGGCPGGAKCTWCGGSGGGSSISAGQMKMCMVGGSGGDGMYLDISGQYDCYGGGGAGGGCQVNSLTNGKPGLGGGPGGTGATGAGPDCDATGYGGGGGGSSGCGSKRCYNNIYHYTGRGCQGIVILRYKSDGTMGIGCATGGTVYCCNGYTIHCFISDGTFCVVS